MKLCKRAFVFPALWATLAWGGEVIDLTPADVQRLGLVFAPVAASGIDAGVQVPAEVIPSPESRSALIAPFDGIVEGWRVAPGAAVTAGQVVAEVGSQALLASQQAWIAARNRQQQLDFNLDKDEQLFAAGVIAEKRLAQTRRDQAAARFEARAAAEQLARAGFDPQALEQLAAGTLAPGRYFITAPAAGVLAERAVDVGDTVTAQTVVGTLRQSGAPWLRAQVPAALAETLTVGQALSAAGVATPLRLRQKDERINPASQTVEVLAEFSADTRLLAGRILPLVLPDPKGGVLIPASAVVHTGDDTTVYVGTAAGVEARPLALKPAGRDYLATAGIAAGEQMVVAGAALLKGSELGLGGGE